MRRTHVEEIALAMRQFLASRVAAAKKSARHRIHVTRAAVVTFLSEMSLLTGAPTSAPVEVVEGARFVSWPTAELERCLATHPQLRAAL
jgi:CRP-like cAMP-binding protein